MIEVTTSSLSVYTLLINIYIDLKQKPVDTCKAVKKLNMNVVRTEVSLPLLGGLKDERLAFVLDNVLTEAECSDLIKITEDKGYEPALLNVGFGEQKLRTDVRQGYLYRISELAPAQNLSFKIKMIRAKY